MQATESWRIILFYARLEQWLSSESMLFRVTPNNEIRNNYSTECVEGTQNV